MVNLHGVDEACKFGQNNRFKANRKPQYVARNLTRLCNAREL